MTCHLCVWPWEDSKNKGCVHSLSTDGGFSNCCEQGSLSGPRRFLWRAVVDGAVGLHNVSPLMHYLARISPSAGPNRLKAGLRTCGTPNQREQACRRLIQF